MRNTFVFSCCTGEASKYLHNEKNSNIHNGRKKQYNKTPCTHQATLTNINMWSISKNKKSTKSTKSRNLVKRTKIKRKEKSPILERP